MSEHHYRGEMKKHAAEEEIQSKVCRLATNKCRLATNKCRLGGTAGRVKQHNH